MLRALPMASLVGIMGSGSWGMIHRGGSGFLQNFGRTEGQCQFTAYEDGRGVGFSLTIAIVDSELKRT